MLDSHLLRASQTLKLSVRSCPDASLGARAECLVLFVGLVPNEYMELVWVFLTLGITLGLMVVFGKWWAQ